MLRAALREPSRCPAGATAVAGWSSPSARYPPAPKCPQPKERLYLELRCEQDACTGRITEGTEAGRAHAALDGPPANLHLVFTNEEGRLLSMLRLSVVGRHPLASAEAQELAPVLAPGTVVRVVFNNGEVVFSGSAAGALGSLGPKGNAPRVLLRVDGKRRWVEVVSGEGVVLLSADEGSRATAPCRQLAQLCESKNGRVGDGEVTLSAEVDPERPPLR